MTNNYYQKNNEKLEKEEREREKYQNPSEDEKDKKRQYSRKQHRNLSKEEKEKKLWS